MSTPLLRPPGQTGARFGTLAALFSLSGLFFVYFESLAPTQISFLGLGARFWFLLLVGHTLAMVGVAAGSGIPHYRGAKRFLALLDLSILAIAVHTTGGPSSLLGSLYVLQIIWMSAHCEESRAQSTNQSPSRSDSLLQLLPTYAAWYLPALLAAWVLSASESPLSGRDVGRFLFLVLTGLLVRNLVLRREEDSIALHERNRAADFEMERARGEADLARRRSELLQLGSQQQETRHWINLVAGLTHSIGNEVLAFHSASGEILEDLEGLQSVPDTIRERVQFIQDTNRARLGFVHFLQEFAECQKSGRGRRPIPKNLKPVPVEELLRQIREKVRRLECRELDPDDPDHQVQKQLAKHLDLRMVVKFDPVDKKTIQSGRIPILEFVFYEFIKNALRNCSGRRSLKIVMETRGEWVSIQFINDLDVEAKNPPPGKPGLGCSNCRKIVPQLYCLGNSDYYDAFCDECLRTLVSSNLETAWEPGQTSQGGKGLGLFVIRHFLETYYFGQTECGIINWKDREVSFKIMIPNDLGAAIERHNVRFDTRTAPAETNTPKDP